MAEVKQCPWQWQSCEGDAPVSYLDVLLFTPTGRMVVGYWTTDGWYETDSGASITPLYWMAIPPEPCRGCDGR